MNTSSPAPRRHHLLCVGIMLAGIATMIHAQPPALIHYQGRLIDGTTPVNGSEVIYISYTTMPSLGASCIRTKMSGL
jgi:hypothetical protein